MSTDTATKECFRFEGRLIADAEILRMHLATGAPYYVYVLCRPDGEPFYVGKGIKTRVLDHDAEARNTRRLTHKLNVIRALHRSKRVLNYHIDSFHKEETTALARERHLIQAIGRHDLGLGPLTNQTDGGEGTSNPSEKSRQRRRDTLWGENADGLERQLANRFYQRLCEVKSVPIKPLDGYRVEGLWANREKFNMTARQAGPLAASAIANRILLQRGAIILRRMVVEKTTLIIENGVGRDILSSRMATLRDAQLGKESFELTSAGFEFMRRELGESLLIDAGILLPESP